MSERLFDGRPFRMLTVVDCQTRDALSLKARANVCAFHVIGALDLGQAERGGPKACGSPTTPGNSASAASLTKEAITAGEIFDAHSIEAARTRDDVRHQLTKPHHP